MFLQKTIFKQTTFAVVPELNGRFSWCSLFLSFFPLSRLSLHSVSIFLILLMGFPGGSVGKESACGAGDPSWIPGSGSSPAEGNGTPLQCSCLENPMDGGAWWAAVHGTTESQTWLTVLILIFHLKFNILPLVFIPIQHLLQSKKYKYPVNFT